MIHFLHALSTKRSCWLCWGSICTQCLTSPPILKVQLSLIGFIGANNLSLCKQFYSDDRNTETAICSITRRRNGGVKAEFKRQRLFASKWITRWKQRPTQKIGTHAYIYTCYTITEASWSQAVPTSQTVTLKCHISEWSENIYETELVTEHLRRPPRPSDGHGNRIQKTDGRIRSIWLRLTCH